MAPDAQLFASVADDRLSLFDGSTPKGSAIVGFLGLNRSDVAKATHIRKASVRYDIKMPVVLEEWLRYVALAANLVARFFQDNAKAELWFATPNSQLGNLTPTEMLKIGRAKKLLQFVQTALDENPKTT